MRFLACISVCAICFSTACAPTTQLPTVSQHLTEREANHQRELVVNNLYTQTSNVSETAYRILTQNALLCEDRIKPVIGANFHTLSDVPEEYKVIYEQKYKLSDYPTITHVNKGSPSANRLKEGDYVLTFNGFEIKKSSAGIKQLSNLIENSGYETHNLTVLRAGKEKEVTLSPVSACDYNITIIQDDTVNAFADGDQIGINSGMLKFIQNNDELALVLGHELAHNTHKHTDAKMGNALIGGILGVVIAGATGVNVTDALMQTGASAYSQDFESEADYVGLYYAARAGYDVNKAPDLWRRMATDHPQSIDFSAGATHPSTAARFVLLGETVKEIKAKKNSGRKLIPNIQEQAPSS